jgi:hypothetical protein
MTNEVGITGLATLEFAFSVGLTVLFYIRGWHRQFKAMGAYLVVHVLTCIALLPLLAHLLPLTHAQVTTLYFYIWWLSYLVSSVLLFYICVEIISAVFAPFPQLSHFGLLGLRWMLALFAIITVASLSTVLGSTHILTEIAYGLMRSVSVMELCLLAFLCIGMKALRISARDMSFGLALGFGVLTLNDLLHSGMIHSGVAMTTLQYMYEGFTLVALGTWTCYAALPKRVEAPVLLPFRTMLYRWNEIAAAIGHKETQVVQHSAPSFFLSDVEKIVDRAFESTFKTPTTENKG